MKRKAAIIGTGQTKHCSRRDDVSQSELALEAIIAALKDAGMSLKDIDGILLSNMELFEGRAHPELWISETFNSTPIKLMKVATGGTSGTSTCIAGFHQVISGMHDVVLVLGIEKHSEGVTQAGMALTDPFWDRSIASGALGNFALSISQFVNERNISPEHAAMVAVKARKNGCLNPYAHLKISDITKEKVLCSRMLSDPIRLLDMCPQSDGACAIVIASEKIAKNFKKPAWLKSAISRHDKPYLGDHPKRLIEMRTLQNAAQKAYKQAGIISPFKEIDVAEIYEPVSYVELAWYETLGFCEPGKSGNLIASGETQIGGKLPVNPSGGVLCANPVGATGVIRVAEAAKQIMQKAQDYQVENVKTALATGYGVYTWSDVLILGNN